MRAAQSLFFLSLFRRVVRVPARGVKRVSALFSDTLMTVDRRPFVQSGCKRVRAFKKLSIKMYLSGSGRTLSGSGLFGPYF